MFKAVLVLPPWSPHTEDRYDLNWFLFYRPKGSDLGLEPSRAKDGFDMAEVLKPVRVPELQTTWVWPYRPTEKSLASCRVKTPLIPVGRAAAIQHWNPVDVAGLYSPCNFAWIYSPKAW